MSINPYTRAFDAIRERGALWLLAHTTLYVLDKVFDFLLYPLAIIQFGLVAGTGLMMLASLLICIALILLYDRLSETRLRDLLGFEAIKVAAAYAGRNNLATRARVASNRFAALAAKVSLFVYLSVWFDPMTCTVFMRPADYYQMTPRYWAMFTISVVICNVVWGLLVFFSVESVQALIALVL